MSNKKIVKKSKKKVLFAVLVPLMAAAVGVSALVGAIFGAGGNKRLPVDNLADGTTAVSSTTINLGASTIDTSATSNTGVKQLIEYIGGTDYDDLAKKLTSPKLASSFTAKTVTMGGIVWNVMYVSKADYKANGTEVGDVIVTLWQADANDTYKSAYSGSAASDTPNDKYPSAMYGSSLVRATLNGTKYSTDRANLNATGTQDPHWTPFTSESGFGNFLATPANMAWQEVQRSNDGSNGNYPWYFPNDAWAPSKLPATVQSSSGWYYKSGNYYNYSDNGDAATYSAWKDDKLWLPSMVETGWGDTNYVNKYSNPGSGLWNASADQRKTNGTGTSQYAWLRSGSNNNASGADVLFSSGSSKYNNTTSSYAVRPALHLNLKSAAQAAGLFEQPISYHSDYYGTAPVDADGIYVPGKDTELLSLGGTIPDGLEFAGWAKDSVNGTVIESLEGQHEALELYATFRPKAAKIAALTPADGNLITNYGATDVKLSAAISHTLLNSGEAAVSTFWKYNDGEANLVSGSNGITLTDGANPVLNFDAPTRAHSGKYTLYYTITPTAAEAAKGVKPLADRKVADFTATVYGAVGKVEVKPTLDKSEIYVGEDIVGTQLVGGRVSCASAGINDVAGAWAITSEGVFTSSGKIYAKFTPDDEDIAPIENVEIDTGAIQLTMKLGEDVTGIDGVTAAAEKSFNVDYGSDISFDISGNKITFNLTQDGEAATAEFALSAGAGYTPYLHRAAGIDPDKSEITNDSALLKNISSGKQFTVSYRANDVSFKIYYILQPTTGDYVGATSAGDLDALIADGSTVVFRYEGTAPTGSAIAPLNAENKPWSSSVDFTERAVDTAKTGVLGKVKGDGSSVALVYLKLNEYVVTYSAAGAYPSTQTKTFRYGAKLTEPTQPDKALSTFDCWSYDEAGANKVDFTGVTVTENITLYAQFITKKFSIKFDLNVGDGDNQIPAANSYKLAPVAGGNLHNGKVLWNVGSLFDESFGFKAGTEAGVYTITYTVDNLSSNKRINGIVPSAIGFTFGGWFEEGSTRATTVIRTPDEYTETEIVLTAKWTPTQYAIRFDPQNGSRVTSKTVRNITKWEDVLPETPLRGGYKFLGWFVTTDKESQNYMDTDDISRSYISEDGKRKNLFSVSDFVAKGLFTETSTSITLYAEWESMPVLIRTVASKEGELTFTMDGKDLSDTDPAYIGSVVEVKVDAKPGYKFKNLVFHLQNGTTETFRDGVTSFTVTSRFVCKGTDDFGEEYSYITIGAEYTEQRYTITYHTDGGRAEDTVFARSYSASELLETSKNRAKLPSRLTKNGWDFAGWIFERSEELFDNPQYAHAAVPEGESVYGADLWLVQPYALDNLQEKTYRNVILKAVWTPQEATVYLYNATYNTGDNIRYDYDSVNKYYYIDENDDGYPLVTDAKIDIANPVRDSFDFLGWATTRNGAVVLPAVEGKDFISYTVNPDHDTSGSALNRNNLYAVWHVKGVEYIIMNATNNGATYGGDGITMSAKPAQNYTENDANIRLNYYWYRVFDGMYDQCFTVTDYEDKDGFKWYLDESGNIVCYEKDGKYYDEHKSEISAPVGTKFTVKNFNSAAVGVSCVEKFKRENVAASATPTVTVTDVADGGIYICYVEVVATEGSGTTTRSGGYGEIEITMNKAVYGGLSMEDASVEYNARSRADEIAVSGLVVSTENGLRTITLPDGSKVNVTYTYYVGAGELKDNDSRQPVTDLSLIKNKGEYHVVASFEFAVGGDKGNYEPLASLEADLYILADVLSVLEYPFMHDGEALDSKDYTGVYDGKAYGVDVIIKDTLSINAGSQPVTDVDDVAVDFKVYRVTENGDVEIPAADLPTVNAGTYAVVIVGLKGEASGNYVLGPSVETRIEYTVEKQRYEAADHIHFNDVEVVFDNEVHTLSVSFDDGYSLPDTVTVKYKRTKDDYIPADKDFTQGKLSNDFDNGGRYAGTYNVTVEFTDSEAGNHEAIESMTATLTVRKADFFGFYNVDGKDLLKDAGFVSRSYAFRVGASYNPYIASGMLVDTEHFTLKYTYYRVDATTQVRTQLGSGTHEELAATDELISIAGKYEIVAHIGYNSPLYRNNFEEADERDCTITYEISGMPVESVEVFFKSGFEQSGRLVMLGESFDYNWIDYINVNYEGSDVPLKISRPEDIRLAGIRLEAKNGAEQTTFWHVGSFNVYVSFYETESVAYAFTVKENVTDFKLKYSVDGGAYSVVPEGGLVLPADGKNYSFIIEYSCTGENGGIITASSDAVISAGGLVLGKNVLAVTEDFYLFGEVAVDMYEVLAGVKWQYSTDGVNWTDVPDSNELAYAGKIYQIQAVYGEDDNKKTFGAHTVSGAEALNVGGYVMEVGRSGDYRIDESYTFRITRKKLAFVWDKNSFEYDMLSHTPALVSSGVEEIDEGTVTFGFNYYDANKNRILSASTIITVGTYYVSVTMGGDLTARSNYTLDGAVNAEYFEFAIAKADVIADVYYSESNYGRDITYAGNTELRLNALKADFGGNAQVAGQFRFIEPTEDSYKVIDGKSFAKDLADSGELTVHYLYVPDNRNYNELTGTVTIRVQEPRLKTGEGALSVEFGNGAIEFYLVNQTLDTYGIEVYRLYESTYQENGVWYGARELVENPVFRLEGYTGSIDHYVISANDLSGGKIVLIARDGSNSGKLDIPVIDKTPTGIELANPDGYRKTYYVGETPDFGDIVFRVLFGNDTPAVEVKIGTVKADFNRELTAEDTTFTVNFTYFSVSMSVTFNVAPKEDLQVVKPTDTVLNYTGAEIAVPELKFTVDGNTIGQNALDGVEVSVSVYFGENNRPVMYIMAEGTYAVVYEFTITNPRFNAHEPENVVVVVTTNPYTVERTLPENSQTPYTGKDIEVPKPTIGQVTDSTAGGEPVSESRIIRVYEIFDEKENRRWEVKSGDAWTVVHSGRYVITVTVRVAQSGGAEPFTAWSGSYEIVVTQAQNDVANASVTGPDFVIIGSDGSVDLDVFKVTADFGAEKENVIWEYSTSRDGGYSTTKPAAVGSYYVRARIAETDDYQGLTTLGKLFEIRNNGIDLGEDGSITGENGVGENWSLEIKHMEADAVSQTSISKQNVLDGYEVLLKKANGAVVSGEGAYTVRVKLSEELSGRNDLKVFFKDADGRTRELKATVKDGYVKFTTSEFGSFIITSQVAGAPVGLLVAVIVLGVVAAGGIAACIIVFVKKRKGAQK